MSEPYFKNDLVTLYHGDCLEITEWLDADVLVTDPPYGVSWKGIDNYTSNGFVRNTKSGIANDNSIDVRDMALNLWGAKPGVVFGSWRIDRPKNTNHRLIWHKQGQAPGPTKGPFMSQDEEIYIIGKGFISTSPPMRSVIATKENRSLEVARVGHPTPKPVGLMEILIKRCPLGVLADPFAGSGATLIAARNLGRKSIGVEMEERYCELIANRLSQEAFDFGGL
jgi:site-specific DNA-methyltransferase (adenine-specific)